MKKQLIILSLSSLTLLFACNKKSEERVGADETTVENMKAPAMAATVNADMEIPDEKRMDFSPSSANSPIQNNATINKKKIIKDGNISIKTKDIVVSKASLDELVKQYNGYYENEDLQNNDQLISYNLRVRVPSDNFEKIISTLENGKDEITNKNIQARDVSEEYYDVESRLVSKREYLNRYKALLAKASTVKDILAIEENIRVLQEEIESSVGRLKYLNDQVSYSTLNVNLFKEKDFIYKPQSQDKFLERVKKSLSNGWNSIVSALLWIISIWPLIVSLMIVYYVVRRFRKNRKSE